MAGSAAEVLGRAALTGNLLSSRPRAEAWNEPKPLAAAQAGAPPRVLSGTYPWQGKPFWQVNAPCGHRPAGQPAPHCPYLAALARMDAVVEARRLVPAHAALHVEAAARGPVTARLQLVQQRGWGGAPGEVCRHTTGRFTFCRPSPFSLTQPWLSHLRAVCHAGQPLRPVSLSGMWG